MKKANKPTTTRAATTLAIMPYELVLFSDGLWVTGDMVFIYLSCRKSQDEILEPCKVPSQMSFLHGSG